MIFDEITLPFNLSIVWVRFMCNKKIMVEDMKTWDDQFYRMCFLYQKEKNIAQFELKWKKALVTNNNLFSYIEFKIQEEIDQYIPPKCLLAMKKGFLQSSMIQKILKILTVKQTQQLLNGISCFCPQKLLTFVKWKPSLLKHPIQKFFLQWIQTAPLTKFLQWSTGCPHLPLQKFSLTIGLDPLKKYPTAHTCFNQVNLCPSPNYEDFQNKMELALQTQAFFLK